MKMSRRDKAGDADVLDEPMDTPEGNLGKGRPTPKRRDSQGKRGPVSAPRTRKEAIARSRQLAKEQQSAKKATKPRTVAEQRAALRRGDADALPRRDQGATRKIARDYVDSKRLLSNYLLWLFPLMVLPIVVPQLAYAQFIVLLALVVLLMEWYRIGKQIRAIATERFGKAEGTSMGIGFYAGSRAYLPRRWRLPGPQVERGEAF